MTNYEAITKMNPEQMEAFLDNVLLTGVNLALHAASFDTESEEYAEALDTNPYDAAWLAEEAEDATRSVFAQDGDLYLLNALCDVIFKVTGIDADEQQGG